MMQKHRISTDIGKDQFIKVELKQDFELLEVLSLKFTQKEAYASYCSDYGVVCGRITVNNGYGVPNAKVSIFVPLNESDENDPVISSLYPYKSVTDRDENNYRYNLLPERQQHGGHVPTGTFPDQSDILNREEVLEVYEKHYTYTVKTNESGDFMIWGVPLGSHTIHVDLDLSDIGCFSLRPYDFIKKGVGVDNFERFYSFKSSSDIDGLPQIVSFDKTIEVYPFWGNESICEIGLSRVDFDLSDKGIKIEPASLILVSALTDDNSDSVKRSGKIRKKSGYKCNLQTSTGKVECVRYTGRKVYGSDGVSIYPELEFFNITETIDENGVAMVVLPMNLDYMYTNEFGEQETTNDPNKGIPTTSTARFRIGLDFDEPKISTAKYLIPNIREFNKNTDGTAYWDEYCEGMLTTYQFSDIFEDYIKITPPDGVTINSTNYGNTVKQHKLDLMLGTNNNDIPEDYFYKFIFGKVYTVSSFQGTHYESSARDAFLGIKQIRPNPEEDCSSKANYIPVNFGFRNRTKFNLLLAQVLLFLQYIFSMIFIKSGELLGSFVYSIYRFFYSIYFLGWRPFDKFSQQLEDLSYKIQDRFTQQLPLTIYPDCEECTTDDESIADDNSFVNDYCRVAEIKLKLHSIIPPITPELGVVLLYINDVNSGTWFKNLTGDTSFIFSGETAIESEGLCASAHTLNYTGSSGECLLGMNNETAIIPNESNTSRYYAEVFSLVTNTGSTYFTDFLLFFNNDTQSFNRKFVQNPGLPGGDGKEISFSLTDWEELTGLNYLDGDIVDTDTYAILRIHDRMASKQDITIPFTGSTIEEGCTKYDKTYNESIVYKYLYGTGEYGDVTDPLDPLTGYSTNFVELLPTDAIPSGFTLLSTIIGTGSTNRLPRYKSWSKIPSSYYDRRTKSGLSEFRDGVFTVIPVIKGTTKNTTLIQEWYRRKRVGLFFCGGVVNYSFIDNWLNGVLYFFKFDKRIRWDNQGEIDLNQRRSKFARELVFFNVLDENFYYRSTPYLNKQFTGQTFNGNHELLHPTTFYDVGVRDEFLYEICTDPKIDPTCSVIRDVTKTSYQDPGYVVEYAINYRLDINDGKFDVNNFFSGNQYGSNIKVLDGDVTQLMAINCEAGIEAFDMDSPHYYNYNGELMDPEDPTFATYFKSGGVFGPTPIDFKLDSNGAFIRLCLNNRLGDYSQKVPFYLWDKGGTGFGPYSSLNDQQKWDKTKIASMKLQRLFSISNSTGITTNYVMSDNEEEYILKPMTITHNTFSFSGDTNDILIERFENISLLAPNTGSTQAIGFVEGELWLEVLTYGPSGYTKDPLTGNIYVVVNQTWTLQPQQYVKGIWETFLFQTLQNYTGNKQVLSTPFLFYFGLRPDKTSVDILIKYFGAKGAFPSIE